MLSIVGTAILIWIVFAILDGLFIRRKVPYGKRFVMQDGNGLYWVVEEQEQAHTHPDEMPSNLIQFKRGQL